MPYLIIGGSFAKNDLQLEAFDGPSPPCIDKICGGLTKASFPLRRKCVCMCRCRCVRVCVCVCVPNLFVVLS